MQGTAEANKAEAKQKQSRSKAEAKQKQSKSKATAKQNTHPLSTCSADIPCILKASIFYFKFGIHAPLESSQQHAHSSTHAATRRQQHARTEQARGERSSTVYNIFVQDVVLVVAYENEKKSKAERSKAMQSKAKQCEAKYFSESQNALQSKI